MIEDNNKLKRLTVFLAVVLSVFLICLKIIAFIKTDSLSIFSSLIDSVTDLFASLVSFIAVYFSTKPASITHRFGYGKTEALSALLQGIFVGISGIFVIYDGINRFINPVPIEELDVGIIIMLIGIFSTLLLVMFQTAVAKKTNSLAILADRTHYTVDFLTNSAVILSLVFIKFFNFIYFDTLAACFISLYLLHSAYKLAKESIEQITDKELSDDIKDTIRKIVEQNSGIRGMHDFRTRSLGDIYYFELHLEIDGSKPLFEAHNLATEVEHRILEIYPNSQVLIHQDPYGLNEDRLDHQLDGFCKL